MKVLVMDIDGTLTPNRSPIEVEMIQALQALTVPFHVNGGSHLPLLENQFFKPLNTPIFNKTFFAFISNGSTQYSCDYSTDQYTLTPMDVFSIKEHLGNEDYEYLINHLGTGVIAPYHIKRLGDRIVDRGPMINFAPTGRKTIEDAEAKKNRELFIAHDKETKYRDRILEYYKIIYKRLMRDKGLDITKGGQTSMDIGVVGQNKAKAIRVLLRNKEITKLTYIGDALYDNGNDAPVKDYIDSNCPDRAEYFNVSSYKETIELMKTMGVLTPKEKQ